MNIFLRYVRFYNNFDVLQIYKTKKCPKCIKLDIKCSEFNKTWNWFNKIKEKYKFEILKYCDLFEVVIKIFPTWKYLMIFEDWIVEHYSTLMIVVTNIECTSFSSQWSHNDFTLVYCNRMHFNFSVFPGWQSLAVI